MKKIVSVKEMKEIDRRTTEDYGIPSIILMENAGRSVADAVCEMINKKWISPKKIAVFCGHGNNGGDGFVAARYLANRRYATEVIMIKSDSIKSLDALTNLNILKKLKIPLLNFNHVISRHGMDGGRNADQG